MPGMGSHIGTLVKPHGYKGELLLKGNAEVLHKLKEGIPLFIGIDGQRVPFFIEEIFNETPSQKVLVKFEFINSDEEARRYSGCKVYSDSEENDPPVQRLQISNYTGFRVVDRPSGKELTVTDYIESEENPLLVLDHKGSEVLLPLYADYILDTDHEAGTIIVLFPEGLLPPE